jgi:hypothetical protein
VNLARRFKAWLHKVTAPDVPMTYLGFLHEARDRLAEYGPNPTLGDIIAKHEAKTDREAFEQYLDDAGPEPTVIVATDMDGGAWRGAPRRKMTRAEHDEVFGHNRKR